MRNAQIQRKTNETDVHVNLELDGSGQHQIHTGVGFLDHMLSHIALHGLFDLQMEAEGDLEVDAHHTIEDCALTLGQAFDQALGERLGIKRIASAYVPMDDTLARVAVDLSGRPYSVFHAEWQGLTIGQMPVTMVRHFFSSFSVAARCNLHAHLLYSKEDHHGVEALFKALGRALDEATQIDPRREGSIPTTKGTLE
jgi:imidazoleglycerol-phosphate dehydratase